MIKKFISIILTLSLFFLCGCTNNQDMSDNGKFDILCSTFPQYDWVRCLTAGSDGVNVSLLIDDGTDTHSFQPSADNIINITSADMFIYNGGNSDAALEDILSSNSNENQITLCMMEELSNYLLQETHTDNTEHKHEYDEHIWLSLKCAKKLCLIISEHLKLLDPNNADIYTQNTNSYIDKINTLDAAYESMISTAKTREVVIIDRFPFRYLADDYSLICHSAFPGCSSETDAGFNTILQLADKLDTLGSYSAITIEHSNVNIADAVKEATKAKQISTYTMNSLQTVTRDDIESGLTYLSAMESNLDTLKKVLN